MKNQKILITGGAGFIGSNLVHYLLGAAGEDLGITVEKVVNLDKLTYAGNLSNLAALTATQIAALQGVDKVDATMCAIRDAGRIKSRDRIAVLACLNIAHELGQEQVEATHQQRLGSLIDRLDQALASNDNPD